MGNKNKKTCLGAEKFTSDRECKLEVVWEHKKDKSNKSVRERGKM